MRTLCHRDLDVRDAALIAVRTAHRSRADALHARTFVRHRALHVQIVHVHIEPFFLADVVRVLHCRAQQLLDRRRDALVREHQRIQRFTDTPAFDQLQH